MFWVGISSAFFTITSKFDYIVCRNLKKEKRILRMHMYQNSCQRIFLGMRGMGWWHGTTRGHVRIFLRDTDKHLQQAKLVNFDIIHRHCHGEEIPKGLPQYYQTVTDKTVSQHPNNEQDQILLSAFRTDRKDRRLFFLIK